MTLIWGRSLSLSLSLCHIVSKGFLSHGWCTQPSTAWPQSPSAVMGSSVQLCCSLSCFSLSSFPSHPVTGRWIRHWAPPCSCFTSFSWSSVWCWKIASLSVPFPSEQRRSCCRHPLHSSPGAEYLTCTNNISDSPDPSVETVHKAALVSLNCCPWQTSSIKPGACVQWHTFLGFFFWPW